MEEKKFICPHCWQNVSMLIDKSVDKQNYIEDCESCCNPLEIFYEIIQNEVSFFDIKCLGQ